MPGDDDPPNFRDLVGDVAPLDQDRIVPPQRPRWSSSRPDGQRRPDPPVVGTAPAPESFHRGGLQQTLLRRLRRGSIRPQARVDLHGLRRERAREQLSHFIDTAAQQGRRTVLVIHGKGSRSAEHAVLREMARALLREHPLVLAYCPAVPADGGEGATYVCLRRPDRAVASDR